MRTINRWTLGWVLSLGLFGMVSMSGLSGCSSIWQGANTPTMSSSSTDAADQAVDEQAAAAASAYEPADNDVVSSDADTTQNEDAASEATPPEADEGESATPDELAAKHGITIVQDLRPSLAHGPKGADYQKYIVIHDTEGLGDPQGVIDWWDSNGNLVAAHFVIGLDGTIVQAVPLDEIAHHAGFGDAGHNDLYGVTDESRDDKLGTTPVGDWAPDYGMNSYSVGIELVHLGSTGDDYPQEQLEALDKLIAYIDDYYGSESEIIDHKAWRTGNSDTSAQFEPYLTNYQASRTHDGS